MHARDGALVPAGDGISLAAVPDITSGYRAYAMDQLRHMITDYRFDWIHMDTGIPEAVNWKTRTAVQSADWAEFYGELSDFLVAHDVVLVQNVAYTAGLWSHGSYLECQQPDRWEAKDWRVLGVGGYFAAAQRAGRPGTWWNLCYGTSDDYARRNLCCGMRGWTRGWLTWWRNYPQRLACENIIDELLDLTAAAVDFSPNWWRLETDRLELLPLARGSELVVSALRHADTPGQETFSLDLSRWSFQPKRMLFAYDLRPMPVSGIDLNRGAAFREPWIEITRLDVGKLEGSKHAHAMDMEGRRNYYHVLSQIPAFVYRADGRRTSLPLAENRGVVVRGSLLPQARQYTLSVHVRSPAAVMAFVPPDWDGATVTVGGKTAECPLVELSGHRFAAVELPAGESRVALQAAARQVARAYENPMLPTWELAVTRMMTDHLRLRACQRDGRACLGMRPEGASSGSVQLHVYPHRPAESLVLDLLGRASGGKCRITLAAGAFRTADLVDDFNGWRQFVLKAERMQGGGSWQQLSLVQLQVFPKDGAEMVVGGLRLLPQTQKDQDQPRKKRLLAAKTATPPVLDGQPAEKCWKQAQAVSRFYRLGSTSEALGVTQVRACYDQANLYLFMEAAEPIESLGLPRPRGTEVWSSDHLEIYLDPFRDGIRWFHLLVDPAGTIQDCRCDKMGRDFKWNGDFQVKTSLNWKAGWRIPFATLGRVPKDGDVWGINFARKDIAGESSNWNAPGEWLDLAGFGRIEFTPDWAEPGRGSRRGRGGPLILRHVQRHAGARGLPRGETENAARAGRLWRRPGRQAPVLSHRFGVHYPLRGNIRAEAGTVAFWVSPINWNRETKVFSHFFAVHPRSPQLGDPPPFGLLVYKFRDEDAVYGFDMGQELTAMNIAQVPMGESWKPGGWNFVAFTWDAAGAALYVNGQQDRHRYRKHAPGPFDTDTFHLGGPYFVPNEALTLIRDFRLYSRR